MKKDYQPMEMEVISLDNQEVIITSGDPWEGEIT